MTSSRVMRHSRSGPAAIWEWSPATKPSSRWCRKNPPWAARRGHLVLIGERRHEVSQERERGGRLGGLGRGGAAGSADVGTLLDPVVMRKDSDDDAVGDGHVANRGLASRLGVQR